MNDAIEWLTGTTNSVISIPYWQQQCQLLSSLYNAERCRILQVAGSTHLELANNQGNDSANQFPQPNSKLISHAHYQAECHYIPDLDLSEFSSDNYQSWLSMPLCWPDGTPFGLIVLESYRATEYHQDFIQLLASHAHQFETELQLLALYQDVRHMAVTDSETGLYTECGFMIIAEQHFRLARRMGFQLGVLHLALDNLDSIYQHEGKARAELACALTGQAINDALRDCDIAGHLQANNFVAVLQLNHEDDHAIVVERIAMAMRKRCQQENMPELETHTSFAPMTAPTMDLAQLLADARTSPEKSPWQPVVRDCGQY